MPIDSQEYHNESKKEEEEPDFMTKAVETLHGVIIQLVEALVCVVYVVGAAAVQEHCRIRFPSEVYHITQLRTTLTVFCSNCTVYSFTMEELLLSSGEIEAPEQPTDSEAHVSSHVFITSSNMIYLLTAHYNGDIQLRILGSMQSEKILFLREGNSRLTALQKIDALSIQGVRRLFL